MFINALKTTSIKNELHQKESKKNNSDEEINYFSGKRHALGNK